MKITKRQLKILIENYLLKEITPEIAGTPGQGGDPSRAAVQAKYVDRTGIVTLLSELILDFSPAGTAIDAGHLAVALKKVADSDGQEGKLDTTFAAIGFVPGAGVVIKKLGKSLSKVPKSQLDDVVKSTVASVKKKHPDKFTKTDDVSVLLFGSTPVKTGRTSLKTTTGRITTMKDEYDAMVKMHKILGKHSVRPEAYKKIKGGGEYNMEKINGDTLADVLSFGKPHGPDSLKGNYTQKDIKSFRSQVEIIQKKLKSVGFEHGDIKSNNFFIDSQTKTVKIFDPAGLRKGERTKNLDDVQFGVIYKEFDNAA